jgi:hypothetical protein
VRPPERGVTFGVTQMHQIWLVVDPRAGLFSRPHAFSHPVSCAHGAPRTTPALPRPSSRSAPLGPSRSPRHTCRKTSGLPSVGQRVWTHLSHTLPDVGLAASVRSFCRRDGDLRSMGVCTAVCRTHVSRGRKTNDPRTLAPPPRRRCIARGWSRSPRGRSGGPHRCTRVRGCFGGPRSGRSPC